MNSNLNRQAEILTLLARGEFSAAEGLSRTLLEQGPPDPSVLVLLGAALAKQDRPEEGLAPLNQALKEDKSLVEGWNWLSICLRNLGRFKESETACLTALQIKPDDAGSNFNLGLCYMAAQEYERASKCL